MDQLSLSIHAHLPVRPHATFDPVNRDGQFVPDQHAISNIGDFNDMADAIVYSAISWVITGNDKYAQNVNKYINTWFVDKATAQNPNRKSPLDSLAVPSGLGVRARHQESIETLEDVNCRFALIHF